MAQELLHRADIVAILEEVRRERVPKGMTRGPLAESGLSDGLMHGALQHGFVQVMPPSLMADRVGVEPRGREDPLPDPFPSRVRILPFEGTG
jgi:hypothetical protein